jgi:hypothetical protein
MRSGELSKDVGHYAFTANLLIDAALTWDKFWANFANGPRNLLALDFWVRPHFFFEKPVRLSLPHSSLRLVEQSDRLSSSGQSAVKQPNQLSAQYVARNELNQR